MEGGTQKRVRVGSPVKGQIPSLVKQQEVNELADIEIIDQEVAQTSFPPRKQGLILRRFHPLL